MKPEAREPRKCIWTTESRRHGTSRLGGRIPVLDRRPPSLRHLFPGFLLKRYAPMRSFFV